MQTSRACKHRWPEPVKIWRHAKRFLAEDFHGQCVYCLVHEAHFPPAIGYYVFFSVDHFKPRDPFSNLLNEYKNLYYSCVKCNRQKDNIWPTPAQLAIGARFIDPCEEEIYNTHLRLRNDGSVEAKTAAGKFTCNKIGMNRTELVEYRSRFLAHRA